MASNQTPVSISENFASLLSRIQPTDAEITTAKGHIATIKTRLEATFPLNRLVVGGSFARGTFIRGNSDVDVFAVFAKKEAMHGGQLVSSTTVLGNVRAELAARYPSTPVKCNVHAVVVGFAGVHVDVVPALFDQLLNNRWPQYLIPDGGGGWMATCPDLHNAYISNANTASGGKLRSIAQLIKFWRECRNPRVPLSSFHIEMLLAQEMICSGVKTFGTCVTSVLQRLVDRECRAMQDPLGISGYIRALSTEAQRNSALASVKNSRDHAKFAQAAALLQVDEAKRQWNIVFNGNFPKY